MKYWKAHFKDKLHDEDIIIKNSEDIYKNTPLSFELDGFLFKGNELGEFLLDDISKYEDANKKFNILKVGPYKFFSDTPSYLYVLQRCQIYVEIPINVLDLKERKKKNGILKISFSMVEHDKNNFQSIIIYCDNQRIYRDDIIVSDVSLYVGDEKYESDEKSLSFELILENLLQKMCGKYRILSCFTCQYSDYSPYGNDNYGTLNCYKRHKNECLKVHNKDDYFKYLEDKDFDARQETYLCDEYKFRNICSGYRGFVKGTIIKE